MPRLHQKNGQQVLAKEKGLTLAVDAKQEMVELDGIALKL